MALPRELMRVLDRIGGRRAAHAVPPPAAAAHAVPGARAAARALARPRPEVVVRTPPRPAAAVHGARGAGLVAEARTSPPPVAQGHAVPARLAAGARSPGPVRPAARVRGRVRPLAGRARALRTAPPRTRRHRVPALPPRPARRPGRRVAALLAVQMRRRVDWAYIDRARLHRAWARMLAQHRVPAGDVRLLGVYGAVPLEQVEGVGVAREGERALLTLRRSRRRGPVGDLAVGRHVPTGRLLPSLVRVPDAGP